MNNQFSLLTAGELISQKNVKKKHVIHFISSIQNFKALNGGKQT